MSSTDVRTIHSLEELCVYAYEVSKGAQLLPVLLGGEVSFSLRIMGASWEGKVDKRSAQYILSLQEVFDNLLSEYGIDVTQDKPLVKVCVRNGSFEAVTELTPVLSQLVNKMSDESVLISIVVAIVAASGGFIWSRYQTRKQIIEQEQERTKQEQERTRQMLAIAEEETARETCKQEASKANFAAMQETNRAAFAAMQETSRVAFAAMQAVADASPEQFAGYERPVRALVKAMEPQDEIVIGNTEDRIPATIAKECKPRRAPRSEETTTYADGEYTVVRRDYDEGEIVLALRQGATTIKGYLRQMDDRDKAAFRASLNRHEEEEELPYTMSLVLNVVHTGKRLKYADILGEGAPREGKACYRLDDILESRSVTVSR